MLNLICKDILIQKKGVVASVLSIFAANILACFLNGYQTIYLFILFPFAAECTLLTNSCLVDDKNKSYIVLSSLPVNRRSIVIARYLSVFIFSIIGICSEAIFTALINGNKYGSMKLEYMIICLGFIIVLSSLYLPVYFKAGYAKTKYFIMGLFFVMFLGTSFINQNNIGKIINTFKNIPYWSLYAGGILICFILMFISLIISISFYNSREFSE